MIHEEGINIPFNYAAGQAGSRFLTALRDNAKLLGSRCQACARTLAPARSFCPTCGGAELEFVDIGPGGLVIAWTEVPDKGVFVLVRPDDADTAMLHRLTGPATGLAPGVRVRAVFTPERRGHITDLEGFEIDPTDREATP